MIKFLDILNISEHKVMGWSTTKVTVSVMDDASM